MWPCSGITWISSLRFVQHDLEDVDGDSKIDLKLPGGAAQKIKMSDVKNTVKKKESMMPAMHQAVSKQELADLLSYLASLKK